MVRNPAWPGDKGKDYYGRLDDEAGLPIRGRFASAHLALISG